ncbi:Penicillin-binding protein 4* [Thalassoglobus neptunius]|uniref:Penicillin-binding protein 4 n=1 Tax=Thalassoglobus neptunius TaxID=1938619 RepID=A0A5C5X4I7_9PLAN|nr:Penicillin-binding protein 4* [Thalassoglobus neptunius]
MKILFQLNRRSFLQAAASSSILLGSRTGWSAQAAETPSYIHGVSPTEAAKIKDHAVKFMLKYNVPGLSLAMAYRGKLKLVMCVGYADHETGVTPEHRFRVASVSKPLTSILVMKLMEMNYWHLDQKVFGSGILGYKDEIATLGATNQRRLQAITLRHLLEHSCGGWGNQSRDPMFSGEALDLDHDGLIRWVLKNRPLDHDPGQNYSYSNFGYCLLGRCIEKRFKMTYENAFKAYVLQPHGMKNLGFEIGGNSVADKRVNEVTYYGQDEDAYHKIMNVTRMDAHGGWIATPTDLVRLVTHVDGFPNPSDLLNSSTLRTMTTPSPVNPNYAKGWSVNKQNNWWHMGSFNGGASVLARINDQHVWAATVNTRSKDPNFGSDLDGLPWKIKGSIRAWGGHDLFG